MLFGGLRIFGTVVIIIAGTTVGKAQNAPLASGFDCAKVMSASARLICSDQELSTLNARFISLLQQRRGQLSGTDREAFAKEEIKWLRTRNEKCGLVGKDSAPIDELKSAKPCMVEALKSRTLELLAGPSAAPPTPATPGGPATQATQKPPPLSTREVEAFRSAITRNWHPPALPNPHIFVTLRIKLKRDGSLDGDPILVEASPDSNGPALAQSAKTAVLQAAPFTMLSPADYESWKDIEFKFDPVELAPPQSFTCTNAYSNDFWYQADSNPEELRQFERPETAVPFFNKIRAQGLAYCASERAAHRCCGPSAYPSGIRIALTYNNNFEVIATSNGDNGPWQMDSAPMKRRVAAEALEQQRKANQVAAAVSAEARQQFASGTGDPLPGVWSSGRTRIIIRKEGALYTVKIEGDNMLRGEYAGPYANNQIALGGMAGNISVLPSSAQLIFGGERFSKVAD